MRRYSILPSLLVLLSAAAQVTVNGPMQGYADLVEASIWLQCDRASKVELAYWDETQPDRVIRTGELATTAENAHALTFRIGGLEPGHRYGYRVILDGKAMAVGDTLRFSTQPLWRWRGDPPPFKMALGSCAYANEERYDRPGKPYGDGMEIFNSIADQDPDLMLWLGDNIYLREPDWGSWSGILHRYTHTRSLPALQRLLRSTKHVAIWDDHDFGPNDADASFVNAPLTRTAFDLFWANPSSGAPGATGITTMLQYHDIDMFLLDDRSARVPVGMKSLSPTILGPAQIDWLIQALKYSRAPFKMVAVGSQFLSTENAWENFATIPAERQGIIDRIKAEGITGVVFLTGDRHFTELSMLDFGDGNVIHDLTVSPLTAGVYKGSGNNSLLVDGTHVEQRAFGLLDFTGPANARKMGIEVRDTQGTLLWQRTIDAPARKP